MFNNKKENKIKRINTSPTSKEVLAAKDENIDLAKNWNAYTKEVRVHIYVSNMKEMVRFWNKILDFPVVRYWRYDEGDGTMISVGGNIIELFTKGKRNYYNKSFSGSVSLSLKVNDVYKMHDKLSRKNIKIGELVKNPWGDTSFSVLDPEGNRIVFFSPYINKEKFYKVKKS